MIFSENSAHKTVRKIKFPLVKNRKKTEQNSPPFFQPSSTCMTHVMLTFKAPCPPLSATDGNSVCGQAIEQKYWFLKRDIGKDGLGTGIISLSYLNIHTLALPSVKRTCWIYQPNTKDNISIAPFFLHVMLL